jgi:hypothetical protein
MAHFLSLGLTSLLKFVVLIKKTSNPGPLFATAILYRSKDSRAFTVRVARKRFVVGAAMLVLLVQIAKDHPS